VTIQYLKRFFISQIEIFKFKKTKLNFSKTKLALLKSEKNSINLLLKKSLKTIVYSLSLNLLTKPLKTPENILHQ